ncbi:MAG: PAS domain S-box protein [Verrucomicrobiota bacterium]
MANAAYSFHSIRLIARLMFGFGLAACFGVLAVQQIGVWHVSFPWDRSLVGSNLGNLASTGNGAEILGSWVGRFLPSIGSGMMAAVTALASGLFVTRYWQRSVGLLVHSAGRLADGDYSVQFDEFIHIPEVRGLSLALQRLLEAREQQGRDLRETLRHFHGTFENAAVGVFHLNPNGVFRRVNRRFCDIAGFATEDLLGRNLADILQPEDRAMMAAHIRNLMQGGVECFCVEMRCLRRSGRAIWVQWTMTVMCGENGEIEYAIAFVEDVSPRRCAEEKLVRSEASLRSLMDCSRDSCVCVLDLSGCVLFVNEIGVEVLRATAREVCPGVQWSKLWEVSEEGADETALMEARCGGVGRFRGQRNGGELGTQWWEVTVTAIPGPDGRPERLLSVARDVTLQHVAANALQQAKESAEAASRAKDDLLSALSHELRTPLNPVLLLAGEYARSNDLPARMREDFALIHRNVRLEARLIDDLLDLTKIQRAGLSLSTRLLDLAELLWQVCEVVRGEAAEKQVQVEYLRPEGKHYVRGDSTRLHQIFSNLILNGVKFSPAGGAVRLSLVRDSAGLRVSIEDKGIGITTEELGRIFEPFAQGAHAREPHRFGGLGLGLAIARMLVDRHKGKIWAESPGRGLGATFFVELPMEQNDVGEVSSAQPVQEPRKKEIRCRSILLVEDHDATRVTLARMLGRRGHSVTQAATLGAAMVCAQEQTFDVLISDIGLPDGSGSDLIREYGERFLEGGIALSGFGMEAEVARSLQAGFRKHLTKPIEVETLEETLHAMDSRAVQGLLAI